MTFRRTLCATAIFCVFVPVALLANQAGTLDSTFGVNGAVNTNFSTTTPLDTGGNSAIMQPSGKIVIAGTTNEGGSGLGHVALIRLNSDGTQDFGFGSGGFTRTLVATNELVFQIAQAPDGSLYVGGSATDATGNEQFMVVKYTASGILDPTFNSSGFRIFTIGGDSAGTTQRFDRGTTIVVQSDGKVVIGGYADFNNTGDRMAGVARLNANGTFDGTFGSSGIMTFNPTSATDQIYKIALDASGRVVIAGGRSASSQAYVARLTTAGALDATFATGGIFLGGISGGASGQWRSIGISPVDGSIYVAGHSSITQGSNCSFNSESKGFAAKFTSAGALVTTVPLPGGNQENANSVFVQADGKVVVGGDIDFGGVCAGGPDVVDMAIWRFNSDMSLDTSFNAIGYNNFDNGSNSELGHDAIRLADGSYVVVGEVQITPCPCSWMIADHYSSSGAHDATWSGGTGYFRKQLLGGSPDQANALAIQSDLKVVLAGYTRGSGDDNFALSRYNTDGSLDSAFGTAGLVSQNGLGPEQATAIAIQSDGKLVVAGTLSPISGNSSFEIMRFNTNGTLDTSFGSSGITNVTHATSLQATSVAIDSTGKIYVAGTSFPGGTDNFAICRLTSSGALDATFGGGVVTYDSGANTFDEIYAMAIDSSNRPVVAGRQTVNGSFFKFATARFTTAGALDTAFGGTGVVYASVSGSQGDEAHAILIQPDGKIIAGGRTSLPGANGDVEYTTVRYTSTGALDATWGSGGIATLHFTDGVSAHSQDQITTLAYQYDDKIVALGFSFMFSVNHDVFTLARFNTNGTLDTTFATNGMNWVSIGSRNDFGYGGGIFGGAMRGKFAVGGYDDGGNNFEAARFLSDPPPTTPGAVTLTDSGPSSTDRYTNNVTFSGTCVTGESIFLVADGTNVGRVLCGASAFSVAPSPALAVGAHSMTLFARNGAGDSSSTAPVSIYFDNAVAQLTYTAPVAGSSVSPNPVISGGSGEYETFTSPAAGASVTVKEGAATVCSTTVLVNNTWSCNSSLSGGVHTISVTQTDIAGNTSSAATETFTVKFPTTTVVTSSVNPSVWGQSLTLTATVTATGTGAGTPGGSVNFVVDAATTTVALNASGVATLTTSTLSVGSHTVTVNYTGAALYQTSSGSISGGQTVNKADSTTTVTSSQNPSVFGAPVTITAAVTANSPSTAVAAGSVVFTIDGVAQSPAALNGSGVATYISSALSVSGSPHTFSVAFATTSNFNASSGALSGGQTVNKANTTTSLTSSVNPSNYAQSTTFTATVSVSSPGAGTPTGTVTFFDGTTSLGTSSLSGTTATLATAALVPASHTVTAQFSGDGSFNGNTSPAVTQTVNKINTTTALNQSSASSAFGESVTLTATVTPAASSPATPSGSITFKSGATTVGTAVLDNTGVASLTTSALPTNPADSLTAQFATDSFFNASTSSAVNHAVTAANTSLGLSSSAPSSTYGQSVTFTATITVTSPGGGVPQGTVTFTDGATPLGTSPLTGGVATLSSSTLNAASHTINANYSGSGDHNSSMGSVTQTVSQADSDLALTSSANPSPLGTSFNLIATITPIAPAGGVPPGNVQFKEGNTTIATAAVDASGVATAIINNAAFGDHSYTAIYTGSTNYFATVSNTLAETVTQALSNTALASAPNAAVYGQSVTFTATVTGNAAGGTPTGSVAFFEGASNLGSGSLNSSGVATLTLGTLGVGTHAIVAQYGGSAMYQVSSSAPALSQVVNAASTTTALTASTSTSVFGQSVTFTANVTVNAPGAGTPTGSVTFKDGATTLGTGTLNASGVATYATSALPPGSHNITAVYGSDIHYTTSSSSPSAQLVNKADLSPAVTSSQGTSVFGQSVTITATLTAVAPGAGAPTGTIAFSDGGTSLGSSGINASGVATLTTSALAVGSHTIAAQYTGDTNFNSVSGSVAQTVNQAATTTTLTSSLNPAKPGQSVTFTATVTVNSPGSGIPTGTVMFSDGASTLGSGPLNGSGVATFTTTTLADGPHTITATYAGDSSFTSSASSTLNQAINANHAPVLVPIGNKVGRAQTALSFVITATDTDGDTVSYSANGLPATATLDAASGAFNWTPAVTDLGSHTITFIASDPSSATASETITIIIVRNFVHSDFDADRRGDLAYQRAADGRVVEWRSGALTTVSTPGPAWVVVATGDFNLDGRADIILQNSTTREVAEWQMNGDTVTAGQVINTPVAGWKVQAAGDLNGDGRDDLVLQNTNTGDVAVWLINGLSVTGGAVVGTPGTAWKVRAVADIDGDGRADIVLQNTSTGDVAAWLMNGLSLVNGKSLGTPGPSWKVTAAGDLNGDGSDDLILQNIGNGDLVAWEMSGGSIAAGGEIGTPGTGWSSITTTDLDGDGKADLVLQSSSGPVALWQMNGLTLVNGTLLTAPGSPWTVIGAAP